MSTSIAEQVKKDSSLLETDRPLLKQTSIAAKISDEDMKKMLEQTPGSGLVHESIGLKQKNDEETIETEEFKFED